jgi:uncharacterized protein (TIGR02145 family)
MCQNVGAAPQPAASTLDAYGTAFATTATDTGAEDARGGLFQWGRSKGGSRITTSTATTIPNTSPADDKFYTAGSLTQYDWYSNVRRVTLGVNDTIKALDQNDFLWCGWPAGDPCGGAPWHVPTNPQWTAIYRTDGNSTLTQGSIPAGSKATANTWVWNSKGYAIRPDGVTTTLFLPAAGLRSDVNGDLALVGTTGLYWSSTVYGFSVHTLYFYSGEVYPSSTNGRATGFSVRCVAR